MSTAPVDVEDVVNTPSNGGVQAYFKVKETSGNLLRIVGWAFMPGDEAPAIEVKARDEVVGSARPLIARPDVAELYPAVEAAAQSGFEITLEAHGSGRSELELEAVLPDESRQSLGRIVVVVR
jgi:hypothetical protein